MPGTSGAALERILGSGKAAGIRTSVGDFEGDLAVLAIGVRPATAFLSESGLEMNRGVFGLVGHIPEKELGVIAVLGGNIPAAELLGVPPVLLGLIAYGGEEKLLRLLLLFFAVSCAMAGCVLGLGLLAGGGVPAVNGVFYTNVDAIDFRPVRSDGQKQPPFRPHRVVWHQPGPQGAAGAAAGPAETAGAGGDSLYRGQRHPASAADPGAGGGAAGQHGRGGPAGADRT